MGHLLWQSLKFFPLLLPNAIICRHISFLTGRKYDFFKSAWTACLHHPQHLRLPRFGYSEIDAMVSLAKKRFQGKDATFYIISDLKLAEIGFDFTTLPAFWISSLEEIVLTHKPLVFFCIYDSDEKLAEILRVILKMKNCFFYTPKSYLPTARFFHRDDAAKKVLLENLPLKNELDTFDLIDYENILRAIKSTCELEGAYVEIGVYKGASAHLALRYMKEIQLNRKAYFLDLFEGFSYETAETSPDAFWLGQFSSTSYNLVHSRLKEFENMKLVKCNIITDPIPEEIQSIAICNQ
ncbi:hypothetical protein SAMN02745124_04372 [Desulfofustis glycolicus DSM 9705]|uniref:Macrocin-O-methyltransferase (TylF) n=2 Tax=Desulfofustis glycolicus TaxID=51195 RepID=A0A1M5YRV0_9BACT|nr:hypothetical protein SAMN02745124_04372 [Desulfofustis glycolicus DSM 9705]